MKNDPRAIMNTMKLVSRLALTLAAMTAGTFISEAKINLPAIMDDGMVLQRNATVNIWGTSDSGKTIKVRTSWDNATYRTSAAADGSWAIKARTADAGGPHTITISDGDETRTLCEVLIGEVWLCSGQSNMEMPLMGFPSQPVEGSFEAITNAGKHQTLRIFHVKRENVKGTFNEFYDADWYHCNSTTAAETSAIGYFFASNLNEVLGIPVGLIEADWGGTRIETWMSAEEAEKVIPDVRDTDKNHTAPWDPNRTGYLWTTMIEPLSRFTLRGFLWYQGETNNGHHYEYDKLMEGMVSLWRRTWAANDAAAPSVNPSIEDNDKGEQMPFLFAQLAPYDYNTQNNTHYDICAPLMWESQIRALKAIPNSDIAVNVDLGDAFYIHPPKKKTLAGRFVMLALHHAYGEEPAQAHGNASEWRCPIFKSVSYEDGAAIVEFEMNSTISPTRPFGNEAPILGFEIAGEDRVFHKAEAVAVHNLYNFTKKVKVWSDEVKAPVAVRYAFDNLPGELNLTNTLGLPAYPFRTDTWDDVE